MGTLFVQYVVSMPHISDVMCDARRIFERNVEKKIITCEHYGRHTCDVELKGRVKEDEL